MVIYECHILDFFPEAWMNEELSLWKGRILSRAALSCRSFSGTHGGVPGTQMNTRFCYLNKICHDMGLLCQAAWRHWHIVLSSDTRPSSFVIPGELLTSLTLRFLTCKIGIITTTPVQQGDYENYLRELISTSNAVRTVPSTWYKAFNKCLTISLGQISVWCVHSLYS